MNRFQTLLRPPLILMIFVLAMGLTGCTTTSDDGPKLFNEEETESTVDSEATEDAETVGYPEGEFGYKVEGTVCVKQLHGGCVPNSYKVYEGDGLGIHFRVPSDWLTLKSGDSEASFAPRNDGEEVESITNLFVWRESTVNPAYEAAKGEILDAGTGTMGYYDVTWEVFEGELEGYPVKSEWVKLTVDPYNPYINFVFVLITEPENFEADRSVLNAAVSSVMEETERSEVSTVVPS